MLTIAVPVFAANGDVVGHIYSTDIRTYINGVEVESYNIGGKTAVAIEDLGYDKEFSPIGGKFIWNDTDREIKLEFLYENWKGKFSIEYTPDGITKSGDAEYFSSFISKSSNEYEIVLDFSNGLYADDLIQLFKSVSSGSQALPIHDEEEKNAAVNELINVTINGQAAKKVAVSTVLWNDSSTVYIYIKDIPPISISEIDKINISVNQ